MDELRTRGSGRHGLPRAFMASAGRRITSLRATTVLLLVLLGCLAGPMVQTAGATITVDQFVANTMGKQLSNAQGTYPGECVSLVSQYLLQVHGITTGAWGNAIDYQSGGSGGNHLAANGFSWSADQSFANGDILVWGQSAAAGTGPLGHVGVWYGGKVYDQNDGRHSPATVAGYSAFWTGGYLGHWRKAITPPNPSVVSPGDSGFTKGPASGWYSVIGGGNCGQAIFTYVTNVAPGGNWGRWTFDLAKINGDARYDIQAFIPGRNAGTRNAVYHINAASGLADHSVNQYASSGWVDLGTYSLASGSAWLQLDDYTGEAYAVNEDHEIAFDSVKVAYAGPSSFSIASSAGANGTISPAGATSVAYGGSQTFTMTPSAGYQVAALTVDGAAVPAAASYAFSNVVSAHSIFATFAPIASPTPTPTVTLQLQGLKSGSIKLGRRVTATGVVTPSSLSGGKVTLLVQKKRGSKWVKVRTAYAAINQNCVYGWKYKPVARGSYRTCARIAKTAAHSAGASKWTTFRVK
jgi:hypothetical protein